MRSLRKGFPYAVPGGVPGRGYPWGHQVVAPAVVVHTGGAWTVQKPRGYYLAGPVGLFVRTTPAGRPVRDKFLRRRR